MIPAKASQLEWFNAYVYNNGSECNWFTYDINDVRPMDNYNEPQLRAASAEDARAFLVTILGEQSNANCEA